MCVPQELYWQHAPKTCYNFSKLAEKGYYDGVSFHRVIKGQLVCSDDASRDALSARSSFFFIHAAGGARRAINENMRGSRGTEVERARASLSNVAKSQCARAMLTLCTFFPLVFFSLSLSLVAQISWCKAAIQPAQGAEALPSTANHSRMKSQPN